MARLKVISKGKYSDLQPNQPITATQYIFALDGKQKCLLIRFKNERTETLTALKIAVRQLNAKGNEIETSVVSCENLAARGGSLFALNKTIAVRNECTDFKVFLISASYGKYVYTVRNHSTFLTYEEAKVVNKISPREISRRIGVMDRTVESRAVKKPVFCAVLAILTVIAVFVAGIIHVSVFENNRDFSLYNLEYSFVSQDTVYVTGYRGEPTNVVIPDNIEGNRVVGMEQSAFENCYTLKTLEVLADIEIPKRAFAECYALQSVKLVNASKIGESAFTNCDSLRSVTAQNLKEIGKNAFYSCSYIETVEISNAKNQLKIGENAFAECGTINLFKIDQTVNYSSNLCFFKNTSIGELHLKNIHQTATLDRYFDGEINVDKLVIDKVAKIPNAFILNGRVRSLTINNLESEVISVSAFKDCEELEEVNINSKVSEIGAMAFENTALKTFDLSDVSLIGASAFRDCQSLESIDFSSSLVTIIPTSMFQGCTSLKTVELSGSIIGIASRAFENCNSIEAIEIPQSVLSIAKGAFYGCDGLKELVTPFVGGSLNENSTMDYLFKNTETDEFSVPTSLERIEITLDSITEVGANAFAYFSGLKSVSFASDITAVRSNAFVGCEKLAEFPFGDKLKIIEYSAFTGTGFTEIKLPESVTEIGEMAFSNAANLKTVEIPKSVTSIGSGMLSNSIAVESLTLPYIGDNVENSRALSYLFTVEPINLVSVTVTDEGYRTIANQTFFGARNLSELNLPKGITSVGIRAFEGCESLKTIDFIDSVDYIGSYAFARSGIENFTVPDAVSMIYEGTFEECLKLRWVKIGENVNTIKEDAFRGCMYLHEIYNNNRIPSSGLEKLNYVLKVYEPNEQPVPKVISGGFEFMEINGSWLLTYLVEEKSDLKLPSSITNGDTTVTAYKINDYTFYQKGINSVSLPESVTEIGDYAFFECSGLTEVSVNGSGLVSIGAESFSNCSSLESFDFVDSIYRIGEKAFYENAQLKEANLKNTGISVISSYAFAGCSSMESLVLPTSLQNIGEGAFSGCSSILNLVIPYDLKQIEDEAFYGCSNLISIHNKSSLNIVAGNTNYGYVAQNAITVKDRNYQNYKFEVFTYQDYTCVNDCGYYWIFKYNGENSDNSIIKLPNEIKNNQSTILSYGLLKDVFEHVGNYTFKLYLPSSVGKIDKYAFRNGLPDRIYTDHSTTSWQLLYNSLNDKPDSVYFYSSCIHQTGKKIWKYDSNGNISTQKDKEEPYVVIRSATCTESGFERFECPNCDYHNEGRETLPLGHKFKASGGRCQNSGCTAEKIKLTSENVGNYSMYIQIETSEFTFSKTGELKSLNNSAGSSAFVRIISRSNVSLSFTYGVKTSNYYENSGLFDHNGSPRPIVSTNNSFNENLFYGDTIEFEYYCGSSEYEDDYAYIKDIFIIIE